MYNYGEPDGKMHVGTTRSICWPNVRLLLLAKLTQTHTLNNSKSSSFASSSYTYLLATKSLFVIFRDVFIVMSLLNTGR